MHVQPYFPEPLEVRKNVAKERYMVTLSFIRSAMVGHAISAVAVIGVAMLLEPVISMSQSIIVFLACLLALTLVRRFARGGTADNTLSLLLLAPTVWSLGTLMRIIEDSGSPVWILGLGYGLASVYGAFCGRDFSFVGQAFLAILALAVTLVVVCLTTMLAWMDALLWGLVASAYVFYYVYDLAALLSRRRLGEEPAAVADLYRDLLNFLTYSVRVVLHWRRFRFI